MGKLSTVLVRNDKDTVSHLAPAGLYEMDAYIACCLL